MAIFISVLLIGVCCIIIWRASDGFEAASEYLGRNLSDGVRGATINAIGSSMPELFTTLFFLFVLQDRDGFAGGIGTTAGSAIFNGMIIPAVVILVVVFKGMATSVNVSRKVLMRDGIALLLCELILIFLIGGDELTWVHGVILMAMYAVYAIYMLKTMTKGEGGDDDDDEDVDGDEKDAVASDAKEDDAVANEDETVIVAASTELPPATLTTGDDDGAPDDQDVSGSTVPSVTDDTAVAAHVSLPPDNDFYLEIDTSSTSAAVDNNDNDDTEPNDDDVAAIAVTVNLPSTSDDTPAADDEAIDTEPAAITVAATISLPETPQLTDQDDPIDNDNGGDTDDDVAAVADAVRLPSTPDDEAANTEPDTATVSATIGLPETPQLANADGPTDNDNVGDDLNNGKRQPDLTSAAVQIQTKVRQQISRRKATSLREQRKVRCFTYYRSWTKTKHKNSRPRYCCLNFRSVGCCTCTNDETWLTFIMHRDVLPYVRSFLLTTRSDAL